MPREVPAILYTNEDDLWMDNMPAGAFVYTGVSGQPKDFIGGMILMCPCGCGELSALSFDNSTSERPKWHWDGNKEKPTLTPSIQRTSACKWHGFLTNGIWRQC